MPTSKQALFKAAAERADKLRKKGTEFNFAELLRTEPDKGTTNVRNTMNAQGKVNAHWRPWLGPANRCLVPFTSFAEPDQDHERSRKNIWFALEESRPLAFFAGIWTPACVRADEEQGMGGNRGVRVSDNGLGRAGEDLPRQGHAGDPHR